MNKLLRKQMEETTVPVNALAIWNLGQSGVFVKGTAQDPTIAIDPYLTHSIQVNSPGTEFVREYEPPLEPEELSGVNLVLITHQHDDHLDLATVTRLHQVSPETKFIVPAPHVQMIREAGVSEEIIFPAFSEEVIQFYGAEILPIAAAHTAYETDESGHHLYLGYVVTLNGVRFYHSGDTVVTDTLVQTVANAKPHIAMLPINGRDYERTKRGIIGNMSVREAADFAVAIGADLILPNHYDMFPNNRENPAFFVDYVFSHHRNLKFHLSAVGERFIYFS